MGSGGILSVWQADYNECTAEEAQRKPEASIKPGMKMAGELEKTV